MCLILAKHMQRVQRFIGENKSAINTLNEQKLKMDAKCKDFFYVKCLLAYEDSNTIKTV